MMPLLMLVIFGEAIRHGSAFLAFCAFCAFVVTLFGGWRLR